MPVFEVQTDTGTFQIEAPDQNAAMGALSHLPAAPENSVAGSAKALASGLGSGLVGLAGLPSDAVDLASRGLDAVAGTKTQDSNFVKGLSRSGSQAYLQAAEQKFGKFYEPQTGLEKTLHTVGEFAPAIIGGPEGLATRIATRAVIPGIASELAGQAAEGTGYEPVARVVGALAGGIGGSAAASRLSRPAVAAVPNTQQIAAARTAGYQSPAVQALEIAPAYADRVATQIETNLARQRFSAKDQDTAAVFRLVDDLRVPEFGATHRIQDFDNTRRRLNDLAGAGGSGGQAAQQAIRAIDAATLRVPQSYVVAGNARQAGRDLFDARANAAANFRSERVQQVLERAQNTAAATHSGGNLENEIYKQIRTMLNSPRRDLRGWTAAEREELRAVLPDFTRSTLRRAGKVLGGGGGLGQLAAGSAGAAMFGPLGMFALPALGLGANALGSRLAVNRLQRLDETLRARTPLYGAANHAARQRALAGPTLQQLAPPQRLALQAALAEQHQTPNALSYQPR